MPTSNDTRVRVLAFMKIMASVFPSSGLLLVRAGAHGLGEREQTLELLATEVGDREEIWKEREGGIGPR